MLAISAKPNRVKSALLIRQLLGTDLGVVLKDRVKYRESLKWLGKVVVDLLDHFALGILNCIHHLSRTQHLGGQLAQHILGQVHQVIKVCVGLVELKHGELRIVTGG